MYQVCRLISQAIQLLQTRLIIERKMKITLVHILLRQFTMDTRKYTSFTCLYKLKRKVKLLY